MHGDDDDDEIFNNKNFCETINLKKCMNEIDRVVWRTGFLNAIFCTPAFDIDEWRIIGTEIKNDWMIEKNFWNFILFIRFHNWHLTL